MVLAYQYGLWKLGIPGIVILGLIFLARVYGQRDGHKAVGYGLILLLGLIAGAIALAEGFTIFGIGLLVTMPIFAVVLAYRRRGSSQRPQQTR